MSFLTSLVNLVEKEQLMWQKLVQITKYWGIVWQHLSVPSISSFDTNGSCCVTYTNMDICRIILLGWYHRKLILLVVSGFVLCKSDEDTPHYTPEFSCHLGRPYTMNNFFIVSCRYVDYLVKIFEACAFRHSVPVMYGDGICMSLDVTKLMIMSFLSTKEEGPQLKSAFLRVLSLSQGCRLERIATFHLRHRLCHINSSIFSNSVAPSESLSFDVFSDFTGSRFVFPYRRYCT